MPLGFRAELYSENFIGRIAVCDGALTCLHKVKDGRDIYFFANSQDVPVDTKVVLRGAKNLALPRPA